jgi:phospholipid transport system substrate-binding protein
MGRIPALALAMLMGLGLAGGLNPIHAGEVSTGVATAALTTNGAGDMRQRAAHAVEHLGKEAVAILSDSSLNREQRFDYFHKVLSRDLDIPVLAKFMLGRHWKRVTDEQRAAYIEVFKEFILQIYSTRLGGARIDAFHVIKVVKAKNGKDFFVHSKVTRSGAGPVHATWRIRPYGDEFRIVDLVIEGISMALTLRQEFSSILRKNNGIDKLIERLKARIA